MKLPLYQYADVSTAHITRDDARKLAADSSGGDLRQPLHRLLPDEDRLIVFAYDTGFFVHTQVAEDDERMEKLTGKYSSGLLDLLRAAFEGGAVFLRLDSDGSMVNDCPKYNW